MKKTVENSDFRPDAKVTLTGYEFALIREALDNAFDALATTQLKALTKYIDNNGETVENPTEVEIEEGQVTRITDIYNTFSPNNVEVVYSGKVTLPMLESKRVLYEVHDREAKAGNTEDLNVLMDEYNKPNLEVVSDAK